MIAALFWDQLDGLGFEVVRVGLSLLWQSSILFGAAGLLVFALRRRSAAIRHRVWTAALLLTPLIPVLTWLASQAGSPLRTAGRTPHVADFRCRRRNRDPDGRSP